MTSSKFDVLGTMRAIRDDRSLSTTEKAVLLCAVLRTDNSSKKVRYSLELLAVDANCHEKTVRRTMKNPEVLKYFSKVERSSRRVNLWFATPEDIAGHCVPIAGHSVQVAGHSVRPSTPSSTSSSTSTSDSATASSPNFKSEELGKGRSSCTASSLNFKGTPEPFYIIDLEGMGLIATSTPLPDTESGISRQEAIASWNHHAKVDTSGLGDW